VVTDREVTSPTPFQIVADDGSTAEGASASMSDAQVETGLRWMILSRTLDDFGTRLQRMGRIGLYTPVNGQEAAVVGPETALDPSRDWLVPAYREQPAWVMHGFPLENLIGVYFGKRQAARIPDHVRLLPRAQSVATQLPQAVGIAWSLRIRSPGSVALVFCGEGATSEGDFHEACNLAGVQRVPLVFVVQNNGWAISTPTQRQTAAHSIAARAPGYGFPGYLVDGNDLLAMYEAASEAVSRARSGGGPTLIEARTYRLGFHNTSDNPREYRDEDAVAEAQKHDPIARVERYLARRGSWDDTRGQAARADAERTVLAAIAAAESQFTANSPEDVFANVFATPSPRLERQHDESLRYAED